MDVIRNPENEKKRKKLSKPVTPEDSVRIREAYRTGGAEAARAMREELEKEQVDPNSNPKCPTCSSKNIKRIDPAGKVFKIAALGIFGLGDVHKIFHCLDCGYKW